MGVKKRNGELLPRDNVIMPDIFKIIERKTY